MRDRVTQVMTELNLLHIADSYVGGTSLRSLSGGEQKRLAIALELIASPSLLFLVPHAVTFTVVELSSTYFNEIRTNQLRDLTAMELPSLSDF